MNFWAETRPEPAVSATDLLISLDHPARVRSFHRVKEVGQPPSSVVSFKSTFCLQESGRKRSWLLRAEMPSPGAGAVRSRPAHQKIQKINETQMVPGDLSCAGTCDSKKQQKEVTQCSRRS